MCAQIFSRHSACLCLSDYFSHTSYYRTIVFHRSLKLREGNHQKMLYIVFNRNLHVTSLFHLHSLPLLLPRYFFLDFDFSSQLRLSKILSIKYNKRAVFSPFWFISIFPSGLFLLYGLSFSVYPLGKYVPQLISSAVWIFHQICLLEMLSLYATKKLFYSNFSKCNFNLSLANYFVNILINAEERKDGQFHAIL